LIKTSGFVLDKFLRQKNICKYNYQTLKNEADFLQKYFFSFSDLENQLTEKENWISKMAQEIDHLKKRNEILNHESQNKVKG
jgi:hypothetical protein